MGLEITSMGATEADSGRVRLGAAEADSGRVRLGATDAMSGRVRLGATITDQGRVNIGDLVAILDGLDSAEAQYPGAGQNYTGGSDYSKYLPLSPDGLVGFADGDLAAAAAAVAAAQFPGAGGTYTGGSDYSKYLPLSPDGLVGFRGGEAPAQFPGAGGTYTGGSDYSPMLPLSPNGLAFGALDALTDFPNMGKLEASLLRGAGTEDELLGDTETSSGRVYLGQHGIVRGQVVPAVAVSRSVHLAVTAAREPARRAQVAARIQMQANQIATLAAQRRLMSQRAAAQYTASRNQVDRLDRRIAAMAPPSGVAPTGVAAGVLQKLDLDRREHGRQAVRYAKLHAVAELAARNAATQAVLGRQLAAGIRQGQSAAVAPIAHLFAQIGQSTKQLRVVRQRQRRLWTDRTAQGSLDRLIARRARVGKVILRLELTAQRGPLPQAQQQLFRKAQATATRLDTAIARVRAGVPRAVGVAPRTMNMGFAAAEAQYPGAGQNYTGGSDYSKYLPLSPDGLVGLGGLRGGWLAALMAEDAAAPTPPAPTAARGKRKKHRRSEYQRVGTWLSELLLAEDEPYPEGLGNIFSSIGRAVRNVARGVAKAAKKVAHAACGLLKGPVGMVATAAAGAVTGGAGAAAGVGLRTACGVVSRLTAPRPGAPAAARPATPVRAATPSHAIVRYAATPAIARAAAARAVALRTAAIRNAAARARLVAAQAAAQYVPPPAYQAPPQSYTVPAQMDAPPEAMPQEAASQYAQPEMPTAKAPEPTAAAPLPEVAPTPAEKAGLPPWAIPVGIGVAGAALLAVMLL